MEEVLWFLNAKILPRPGGVEDQYEDFLQALNDYWRYEAEANPPAPQG